MVPIYCIKKYINLYRWIDGFKKIITESESDRMEHQTLKLMIFMSNKYLFKEKLHHIHMNFRNYHRDIRG